MSAASFSEAEFIHEPRITGIKRKWSLQLRSLDPALSECSKTLPVSERRLEGATSYRILLPATPPGDWFRPAGSSFLTDEQSCYTPSVASADIQCRVNCN